MFYDPEKNILYDTETGDEIPIIEDVEYPDEIRRQIQLKKDHDYAISLSSPGTHGKSSSYGSHHGGGLKSASNYLTEGMAETELVPRRQLYDSIPADGEMKMQQELLELRMNEAPENPLTTDPSEGDGTGGGGGWMDDFTLARALQAMEFEIAGETLDRGDFDEKEYRASSCKRQLLTISTLILLTQIGLLVAMVQDDGYAPKAENPLIGPPATTMVNRISFTPSALSSLRFAMARRRLG
jgi:hypothetical protein